MIFGRIKSLDAILATAEKKSLKRSLGAFQLTLLGIGAVIGTGIFVLTATAAQKAGPGMMVSFIVAGVVCALAALCYSELASMVPVAGSAYTYSYAVMGEMVAWLVGWALILEYANSQLLQFRHYDELLTRELREVYRFLERRAGVLEGWRVRPAATRLRTIVLEVTELTERTTAALKFVGDMFTARLYKLSVTRIGVNDFQTLVAQKLRTAEELYSVMIDQFQQARGFVLELMVVIILIIELAFVFRGK